MILKGKEFQNINQKKNNNNYKSTVIEEMKRFERRMQFRNIFWSEPEVACSCFLPLLIRGNFPLGSGMEIKKFFQFFRFHFKEIKRRSWLPVNFISEWSTLIIDPSLNRWNIKIHYPIRSTGLYILYGLPSLHRVIIWSLDVRILGFDHGLLTICRNDPNSARGHCIKNQTESEFNMTIGGTETVYFAFNFTL